MMTDEQKLKVAALKSAIAASAPTTGGAPREVRVAVLKLKEELRQVGTTARALAKALGIHEATLCRWQQEGAPGRGSVVAVKQGRAGGSAGFRVVHVTASDARTVQVASVAATAPPSRSLRAAHARSGLVIDGLDVETLAALLRRMS
jgi:hypothetical protein